MTQIHCHVCGGFITNPAGTSYRESSAATPVATPHASLCVCTQAVVYGPPPGYTSSPWASVGIARSKAARRN
jgi:hypothetical protein